MTDLGGVEGGRGRFIFDLHTSVYTICPDKTHPQKTLRINSDKHTKQEKQSRG